MNPAESEIIFSKEPFSFLTEEQRSVFLANVRFFTFSGGEILIRGGELGNMVYFIVRGECGVFMPPPSENIAVGKLIPGDFFGEMAVLANVKRTATVKTLNEVSVAAMDSQKFKKLCMTDPRIVSGLDEYYKKRQGSLNLFKKKLADPKSARKQGMWRKLKQMLGTWF
ncbi:cyclic nucleotide-binding domain-containing protein [bacterium]|nr:cyclic nucleotide-binding domain-containing protein [bacterium]MBU3955355.1 cyclic nucleotide-binding domain-containing protein [bacterium]